MERRQNLIDHSKYLFFLVSLNNLEKIINLYLRKVFEASIITFYFAYLITPYMFLLIVGDINDNDLIIPGNDLRISTLYYSFYYFNVYLTNTIVTFLLLVL